MTATRSLSAALQHVNRTLRTEEAAALPDAELVGRFVERRDEAAFAALVRRYGLLVFGVCRRVLRHEQDAEDAFQATFLVFARDAATVQRAGAVGNWLYGVAHNVARKARANRHRRDLKELAAARAKPHETRPAEPDDTPELIDRELGAMPDKYRAPIVLCDLLGLTTQQAAAEVGCPPKTLGTRLLRARALLAQRLTRRGIALSAAALAALAPPASAAVPPRWLDSTTQAATGSATVGPTVAALTSGVSTAMTVSSLKFAVLACGLLLVGAFAAAPVIHHLHAAHAPRASRSASAGGAPRDREAPRPPIDLRGVHDLFIGMVSWVHPVALVVPTEDKTAANAKPPAGVWTKKDGEMRLEFGKSELKVSPHGKDDVILILCEYTEKDGVVRAKVSGFEGKEEAKKAIAAKLPVGTEFSFKWKANKGTATLDDAKCEKFDGLKSHLEGEFEEKK